MASGDLPVPEPERASLSGEARTWAVGPEDGRHRLLPELRARGASVYGPDGEKIASIESLAIDEITGDVAYAVMGEGGFLGLGRRRHPVPWSLLGYDPRKDGYLVPLDRQALEKAPALDRDGRGGRAFRQRMDAYYADYGASPHPV